MKGRFLYFTLHAYNLKLPAMNIKKLLNIEKKKKLASPMGFMNMSTSSPKIKEAQVIKRKFFDNVNERVDLNRAGKYWKRSCYMQIIQ